MTTFKRQLKALGQYLCCLILPDLFLSVQNTTYKTAYKVPKLSFGQDFPLRLKHQGTTWYMLFN